MADLVDVEQAFIAAIAAALFPGDAYLSGQMKASPVAGRPVEIFRGWPVTKKLDADLEAGRAQISVFPEQGMTRVVTRWAPQVFVPINTPPILTAALSGNLVTFGGTGGAGQVAAVSIGPRLTRATAAFRLTASDTPATVAAGLALRLPGAGAIGPVLTLPTASGAFATVVADAAALRSMRRQQQGFRVAVWAPSPAARDALAALVDRALGARLTADGWPTEWLRLANGESIRVVYAKTLSNDVPSKAHLWRRDLVFTAEYDTTIAEALPRMVFGDAHVAPL